MAEDNKFFKPKRHIGYSHALTAEQNVALGRRHGLSYLTIAKELSALSTVSRTNSPSASRRFREAAHLAFRLHKQGK